MRKIIMKEKKITFSKLIVILSAILFTCALAYTLHSGGDTSTNVTAITVTGSILLTVCVWYYKKAEAENVRHIMAAYNRQMMNIRYEYNKKMLKLKHEYKAADEQVYQIEAQSNIDDIAESGMMEGNSKLQERADDAMSMPEIQNL